MSDDDIETYQAGGMWHNRLVGGRCVLSSHLLKKDAEIAGRALAKRGGVRHIVRGIAGRVQSELRYEKQPTAPCG